MSEQSMRHRFIAGEEANTDAAATAVATVAITSLSLEREGHLIRTQILRFLSLSLSHFPFVLLTIARGKCKKGFTVRGRSRALFLFVPDHQQ